MRLFLFLPLVILVGAVRAEEQPRQTPQPPQFERDVLPDFLKAQRWFAAKGRPYKTLRIAGQIEWTAEGGTWFIAVIRLEFDDEPPHLYSLPLALSWIDDGQDGAATLANYVLARVRQRARLGVLLDAAYDNQFCRAFLGAVSRQMELPINNWRLRFWATQAFSSVDMNALKEVRRPSMEQSNTSILFDNTLVLKIYRRLQIGVNPEIEIGRFLTEASPFSNIAPLLGAVDVRADDGRIIALAAVHRFIANQGSGWSYTVEYLKRFFEMSMTASAEREQERDALQAAYLALVRILGRRTGELHAALAAQTGDPAFDPEPVSSDDFVAWVEAVRADAQRTFEQLEQRLPTLADGDRSRAEAALGARERLAARLGALPLAGIEVTKTRYHGDYHLGQVLLVSNDFYIVDFEGEPARPLDARRAKHSPLRDVAGMLSSFHYGAATALRHYGADRPEEASRLEPLARSWERETGAAFLRACREAARSCSAYPAKPDQAAALIELFCIEKTLYEVRYELDNRPAWVGIPLERLLRLARGEGVELPP